MNGILPVLMAATALSTVSIGSTTIVEDGFEAASLDPKTWTRHGEPPFMHDFEISSAYKRSGSQAGYARVDPYTPGGDNPKRDKIEARSDAHHFYNGTEYCITASIMPRNWTSIPQWT